MESHHLRGVLLRDARRACQYMAPLAGQLDF
jgi:hypothetical protein